MRKYLVDRIASPLVYIYREEEGVEAASCVAPN